MREAAYGWFARHLAGQGDGSPIVEPAFETEDPEALRCFPGDTRPDDFVTLPKHAAAEGRRLADAKSVPFDAASWKAEAERRRAALLTALGGFPNVTPVSPRVEADGGARVVQFEPEPGLRLAARVEPGKEVDAPRVVLLDLDGGEAASASPLAAELRRDGWSLVTLDLRATGRLAVPSDKVGQAPDHNSAEWGLWVGRPLLGQWVFDVRRLLDALDAAGGGRPRETALVGVGPGGLVALAAAATDPRVSRVAAVGTLASYVSDQPYRGQRLGVIVPRILERRGRRPPHRGPRRSASGGDRWRSLGRWTDASTPVGSARRTNPPPGPSACSGLATRSSSWTQLTRRTSLGRCGKPSCRWVLHSPFARYAKSSPITLIIPNRATLQSRHKESCTPRAHSGGARWGRRSWL